MKLHRLAHQSSPSDSLYLLVVIAGIFGASVFGLQSAFILCFLLLCGITAIESPFRFLFLFAVFLPTNDIFPKEAFLFSAIGIKQVLGFVMIALYVARYKEINADFRKTLIYNHYGKLLKLLKRLILILLCYWTYTYIKNAYFGLHAFDFSLAITRAVNMFLFLFSLIPFMKLVCTYVSERRFYRFLVAGIANMLLFTFLSPYLPELGFKAIGTAVTEFEAAGYARYAGIIADGDSNSLGIYFVLVIVLLLLTYQRARRGTFYALFALSFMAIALTGSRTAFIAFALCLLTFFLLVRNPQSGKLKLVLIWMLPVGIVLAFPFLEMLLARLSLAGEQLNTHTDTNRIGKWILYVDFFLRNPVTFLTGAQQELRISWNGLYYAAHNVYITMVYNGGLLFPILYLVTLVRMVRLAFLGKRTRDFTLLVIPFFLLSLTVSDLGIFYTFLLFALYYIVYKSGIHAQGTLHHLNSFDQYRMVHAHAGEPKNEIPL